MYVKKILRVCLWLVGILVTLALVVLGLSDWKNV